MWMCLWSRLPFSDTPRQCDMQRARGILHPFRTRPSRSHVPVSHNPSSKEVWFVSQRGGFEFKVSDNGLRCRRQIPVTFGAWNRSTEGLAMFVGDRSSRYISSRSPTRMLMTLCQYAIRNPGIKENNPFETKRKLMHESMRARMTLRKVNRQGRLLLWYCTTGLPLLEPWHFTYVPRLMRLIND